MARILVVDDESDMRMALGNVISRLGHKVFEAGDGPAALEFLAKERADLVLLDIRLPGMDGVQILRTLRETDKTTPVIMVTGYGSVESAVEVMQLGASHYLAKPFSNQELRDTVERVLSGQEIPLPTPGVARNLAPVGSAIAASSRGNANAVIERQSSLGEALGAVSESTGWMPAAALAAVGLILAFWIMNASSSGRDVSISHENPTAILWTGETLWSADWLTQTVYESALKGGELAVVKSHPLPQTHITGLAVSKDFVFICDAWKKVIQQRKRDEHLTLMRSVRSPGPNPSGLFWDGKYLWSSDGTTKRFYQHETEAELAVLATYPAPGESPSAIFKDDKYFWSADAKQRLIYQHRLDEKLGVLAAYSLENLDQGSDPLSSFTRKGEEFWLARDGAKYLHVRPLNSFKKIERRQVAK